jgi:hypothetical protein
MRRLTALTLLAVLTLGLSGSGAAENRTIADLNLGAYWHGPDITKKDLAGKVVLVWLWGK